MFDANTLERRWMRIIKQREYVSGMQRLGICVFAGVRIRGFHFGARTACRRRGACRRGWHCNRVLAGWKCYAVQGDLAVDPSFPQDCGEVAWRGMRPAADRGCGWKTRRRAGHEVPASGFRCSGRKGSAALSVSVRNPERKAFGSDSKHRGQLPAILTFTPQAPRAIF